MNTREDVATFLHVPQGRLDHLADSPDSYRRFAIPKRRGGARAISTPIRELAAIQRRVLRELLNALRVTAHAHGFVPGRSIVSGAEPHVGHAVVINLDLLDFFPSVGLGQVTKAFRDLGHGAEASRLLARLCTESAGCRRCLPQGACTSPALSNAVCRRLDQRLADLCARSGFTYTRYADDLSFSGNEPRSARRVLRAAEHLIKTAGFTPHPDKTRIMLRSRRPMVTGLNVAAKPSVPRHERRRLRAILHNAERAGLESQNRDGHESYEAHLRGKIAFITMVDASRSEMWWTSFERAIGE